MPAPHHSVFTGRMPFLPPNQQRQALKANETRVLESGFLKRKCGGSLTGGAAGTLAGVVVEMVDAGASVLARPTVALVNLGVAESARVARHAVTPVVVSAVDTRAVHASHAGAVVPVHLTSRPVVTYHTPTTHRHST